MYENRGCVLEVSENVNIIYALDLEFVDMICAG